MRGIARDAGFGSESDDGPGSIGAGGGVAEDPVHGCANTCAFGDEILPLWQWKPGSKVADGDRVAEIRLGQQYLTLALRTDVDGEGDYGFDVMVPCPHDDECTGRAWVPAYSVTCLFRALNGDLDDDEDIVCTVHGSNNDDQGDEDDPDLEVQDLEAIHG
ncbi:hypothetical protein [Streptomyces pristinaespiralis]|uniref:hypothetical protein n=1 Tax=Streptomyces pristinaespiralis TaxID=38300 RepID=UPI0038392105